MKDSPLKAEGEQIISDLPTNESQLLRVKYTGRGTEVECKICLVNYNESDTVIYLPCLHFYHENCILDWYQRLELRLVVPTCPVCQKQSYA